MLPVLVLVLVFLLTNLTRWGCAEGFFLPPTLTRPPLGTTTRRIIASRGQDAAHREDDNQPDVFHNNSSNIGSDMDSTGNQRHHGNVARHVVEHRAKEKGTLALSQHLAEQLTRHTTEAAGERIVEHMGERAVERSTQRAGREALEKWGERAGEKALERLGEQASERVFERSNERALEAASERATERMFERSSERALERAGERATDRIFERSGERALERAGERSTERLFEQSGERALERASETSARVTMRVGRGLMIALPVLGGFFAFYLFRSDYKRWREEKKFLATLNKSFHLPSMFFVGAGAADFFDAFLHFGIAYGLVTHLSHGQVAIFERLSILCAIVSTLFAVLGEIVSLRIRRRRTSMR